jgi:hypothetical protein
MHEIGEENSLNGLMVWHCGGGPYVGRPFTIGLLGVARFC